MKKLIQIQAELKAPKTQYNAFGKYKYRKCEDILEAVKPLLKKLECTLTMSDEVKEAGGIIYAEATATFTDGKESLEVKAQAGINPEKKGMDIAQSFGSSSSYARKYALNGLFLIDDNQDSDTEEQPKPEPIKAVTPPAKQAPKGNANTIASVNDALGLINACTTLDKLKEVYLSLDKDVKANADVIAKKEDQKELLTPTK